MIANLVLAILACLSLALLLWQWFAALRFPLHQRTQPVAPCPAVTLLKPLKGSDDATEDCLRSWFTQDYPAPIQILFGVASADDPVCAVVRKLLQQFPGIDATLAICGPLTGANAKVSKLVELTRQAKHDVIAISDADVRVPNDFLKNVVIPFQNSTERVGLVNCFYELANPATVAMRWEALAINADFWSQVLQARTLKPIDFAMGAVMVVPRNALQEIGGFEPLVNCLADDYQLGHRIALKGYGIAFCPVVVQCWSGPMNWLAVWKHQLRWARTIRVCQPTPYFFSILSNPTLWPLAWLLVNPAKVVLSCAVAFIVVRMIAAADLQRRLTRSGAALKYAWLAPVKDVLQFFLWILAFAGNHIEWRGERMRLRADGTLVKEGVSRGGAEARRT